MRTALFSLLLVSLTGCSTAPLANFLDCFFPSKGAPVGRSPRRDDPYPERPDSRDRELPEVLPRERTDFPTGRRGGRVVSPDRESGEASGRLEEPLPPPAPASGSGRGI